MRLAARAAPSVATGAALLSLTSRLQGAEIIGAVRVTRDGAWDLCVVNMGTEAGYSWLSFANADAARQRSFEAVEVVRGYETATGIVD